MEVNNDIFLVGNDALEYLTGPMHKNIQWHLFRAIHLVPANRFFDYSYISPSARMYVFRVPPPFLYEISSICYPPLPS